MMISPQNAIGFSFFRFSFFFFICLLQD